MITTDSITRENNAQIAWEIPFPAGGFETVAERSAFNLRRKARQCELVFQFRRFWTCSCKTTLSAECS